MIRWSAARVLNLAQQLETRSAAVMLLQVPDAGRTLVAAADIPIGTIIHQELPMLCSPAASALHSTCYTCLRPLQSHTISAKSSCSEIKFCSSECRHQAETSWLRVESSCDLGTLRTACLDSAEKFPLLIGRLACMVLQQQQQQQQENGEDLTEKIQINNIETDTDDGSFPLLMRGDPMKDLESTLCYAKTGEHPPQEWVDMHSLLLQGLKKRNNSNNVSSSFDLAWFTRILSRLHLNVFRVDTIPPLDVTDPSALFKAAAAAAAGGTSSTSPRGSAVYLMGSMFNHSCDPNVDVTFPDNNALVSFVAATDIPKNHEITISYIDASAGRAARQQQLSFAYGFQCTCPRCIEEE